MTETPQSPQRGRPGWVGPLLGWELLRLGRRGTPTASRVLAALLLLAVLWVVYDAEFATQQTPGRAPAAASKQLTTFAESFGLLFVLAQLLVVFLLTPVFVAGSVVEEKDRHTLEFLLATDLRPREIILGKLLSRAAQVGAVLLAGLPVLAATQVWGGVDLLFIGVGYAVAAVGVLATGAVSANCAVGAASLRQALARGYFRSAFVGILLGAAVRSAWLDLPDLHAGDAAAWLEVGALLAATAAVAVIAAARAVARLHDAAFLYAPKASKTRFTKLAGPARRHWTDPPPIGSRPLWWKERYFSGAGNRFLRLLGLVPPWLWVAVVTTTAMVGLVMTSDVDLLERANVMARLGGLGLVCILVAAVGLSAAGSVARERQQQTLTDLLMVPRSRRAILRAKWAASLSRGTGVGCGVVALILFGGISQGLDWEAVPLLMLTAAVFAACATSLGIYLSVRCQTVLRASNTWMLVVLLLLGATYLAADALRPTRPPTTFGAPANERQAYVWDRVLHPVYIWQQFAFRAEGDTDYFWSARAQTWGRLPGQHFDVLIPALGGLLLYAVVAWLLWRAAVKRFRREGTR